MLDTLRKSASGLVAKILIGLLVLSFAVWGVADIFRGYRGDEVARVGETEIPTEVFRMELQREIQQVSQRIGTYLTMDQARSVGLDGRVLGRLVSEATLDEEARRRGLGMSDTVVAQSIRDDPSFRAPGGQFDRSYFQQYLNATGYSEARFVDEQRGRVLRQTIAEAVGMTGRAPTVLAAAVDRYQREQRTAEYVRVTPEWLDEIPEPSRQDLQTYFDDNQGQFAAPEYRRVGFIAADPAQVAETVEVSDEDARAAFEARADDFSDPERRTVEQIPFQSQEDAFEAFEAIQGGRSFEDAAADNGVADADRMLGTLRRDQIVDPAIADAAFSLERGEISEPVEGTFSTVLVRVTGIEEGSSQNFEDAADQVRRDLALERARNGMLDLYDEIEDDRAAGLTLPEIAESRGLTYTELEAVDARGLDAEGREIEELPEADDFLSETFQTNPGFEADPLRLGDAGYVWFDVIDVTAARDRDFAEAEEDVREAWIAERTSELLRELADEVAERLRGGATFAEVAEGAASEPAMTAPLTRAGGDDFGETAVDTLFATPAGEIAVAPAADGSRLVFRVANVTVPEYSPAENDQMSDQIAGGIADDLLGQYLNGLQETLGVNINQQAISVALGERQDQ